MIGIADYVVFGVALVIPIIMALYYACIKKQKSNFEFLMANRNMSAFPIGFSLAANYLSAVIVTGKFSLSFAILWKKFENLRLDLKSDTVSWKKHSLVLLNVKIDS